jgi:hypothetical protein
MEKSTKISIDLSDADFIGWTTNRLRYLHGYANNHYIINRLNNIQHRLNTYDYKCNDENLDKIISQYFIDFFLIKDESTNIGYTDQERKNLRNAIKQIMQDVINGDVPKEIILK